MAIAKPGTSDLFGAHDELLATYVGSVNDQLESC
jgi:hypothetical protein